MALHAASAAHSSTPVAQAITTGPENGTGPSTPSLLSAGLETHRAVILCLAAGALVGLLAVLSPATGYLGLLFGLIVLGVRRALAPEDRRFCLMLIACGLGARIALYGVLALGSWMQGGSGWLLGDSLGVHNYAWLMVQYLDGSRNLMQDTTAGQVELLGSNFIPLSHPYGYHGMTYLLGAFFDLFGPMKFSGRLLSMGFGAMSGVPVYLIGKQIFGRRSGQVAAIATVFWPSAMLWSMSLMKDSLYILVSLGLMWILLRLQQRRVFWGLAWIVLAVALQHSIRSTMPHALIASVMMFGIVLGWLWSSKQRVWLIVPLLIGYAMVNRSWSTVTHQAQRTMVRVVEYSRGVDRTGGSTYQVFDPYYYGEGGEQLVPTITPEEFVVGWFRGLWYFLLVPFPWKMTTMQQLASYPQMVLWYLMLLWLPAGLWRGWRAQCKSTALIAMYMFLMTSVFALVSGNIGTALRHRDIVTPFLLIFCVGGLWPYAVPQSMRDA